MNEIQKKQLTVLAVPCSRSFVVAPEKWEEFKNQKPNPEIRRQMEEIVKKFKANNLIEEGPVLKKTRKYNK